MERKPPPQPLQEITELSSRRAREGYLSPDEQRRLAHAAQLVARDYVTISKALAEMEPAFMTVRWQLQLIHRTLDAHRLLSDDRT